MNRPERKALINTNRSHKLSVAKPSGAVPPVVLTIAGSDNSGGAGIQADLKTFTTLLAYGTSAITCVVAEHPGTVKGIAPVPVKNVVDQIRLVFEAFPVAGIKTGMLYSRPLIDAVAKELTRLGKGIPLVIDPVMVASSGAPLLKKDALVALPKKLFPLAALVTPNRDEAALLWGKPIKDIKALERAGMELSERYGVPFLVKGGHLRGKEAIDLLCQGSLVRAYKTAMIPGANPHGTGCTLSAAITAGLAHGLTLEDAVTLGKEFITHAVKTRLKLGKYEVLNHLRPV